TAKSHTDIFITLCLGIDSSLYHIFLTFERLKKVVSLLNICYTESVADSTVTLKGKRIKGDLNAVYER
ncbi:hypothetical protein, partial [Enterococcus faecium]|uniref:hypothetical protein n=1 Tax=Enterococcus faecium TaxID=1352 RepID=UPI003D0C1CC5